MVCGTELVSVLLGNSRTLAIVPGKPLEITTILLKLTQSTPESKSEKKTLTHLLEPRA